MTDLQCPARFLVCVVGDRTALGLAHQRVAAVYDGTPEQVGQPLGAELGVPVSALAHAVSVDGVLGRDSDVMDVLAELSDLHRGETVVVTARGVAGQQVEVSVDGDGVLIRQSADRTRSPQVGRET